MMFTLVELIPLFVVIFAWGAAAGVWIYKRNNTPRTGGEIQPTRPWPAPPPKRVAMDGRYSIEAPPPTNPPQRPRPKPRHWSEQ